MLKTIFSKKYRLEKNKWKKDHINFWQESLELRNDRFSLFQIKLNDHLKNLLDRNSVEYKTEITEHLDINDKSRTVKMITISLQNRTDSKFWIYHDMADFKLNKKSQIYEEWGYIKPNDLIEEYLKSTKEILEIK